MIPTSKERLEDHMVAEHGAVYQGASKAQLQAEHGASGCPWRTNGGLYVRTTRGRTRQVQWARAWARRARVLQRAREAIGKEGKS